MLSFIASYLGTFPQLTAHHQPAGPVGTVGPNETSSGNPAQLRSDARLWQVAWSELTMLRRVGRGSFGSVYLAEWSHTRVAVKVLVSQGEGDWRGGRAGGEAHCTESCLVGCARPSAVPLVNNGRPVATPPAQLTWIAAS